jgi:hypothetical protein
MNFDEHPHEILKYEIDPIKLRLTIYAKGKNKAHREIGYFPLNRGSDREKQAFPFSGLSSKALLHWKE